MDRRSNKSLEGTTKPTGKPRNSNFSRKLLLENYTWHESTDDQRPLHGDPRSEQSHGQHQDSDFIPSDDDSDHGSSYTAFGSGVTPDLNVSDSFASDQGTLAGDRGYRPPRRPTRRQRTETQTIVAQIVGRGLDARGNPYRVIGVNNPNTRGVIWGHR
jgi:hypothetical protein